MKKMIKKIIIFVAFGMLISCSSVGKRTVPDSEVVSRDTIVSNSISEVKQKFNEEIKPQNVGIYKKGFRNWKVILFGPNVYYQVFVAEDGKIISVERLYYK